MMMDCCRSIRYNNGLVSWLVGKREQEERREKMKCVSQLARGRNKTEAGTIQYNERSDKWNSDN